MKNRIFNPKKFAKYCIVPALSLFFSNMAVAGGCGTGNKEDFYTDLNNTLGGGNGIVFGYQNCGGYTVDKVKFYLRVDGDNMWTKTKTGDLKINEYHIVTLDPSSVGDRVRAALDSGDTQVQLRTKIWIRAGEKKSKTKMVPYDQYVAWGTNSDGTTTKGNSLDTKYYREVGRYASFK